MGEAAHPGPRRIRARTKVFSVPNSSDDAPLIQAGVLESLDRRPPMIRGPIGLANCQKH